MTGKYDAIIVGGGHNGLVAAAYLGRAGLKPLVLEAREDLGGAASTTTPFGPDYKITTLSYVMSLMPERIIRDLRLREHGYEVIPMGPSYFPFPDGRSLLLTGDRAHDHEQLSRFSSKDADSYFDYLAWIEGVTKVMAPLLIQPAPQVGSKRPRDLVDQLQLAWQMRGLDVRGVGDVTRLMTVSVADLLDDWFDSPEIKGALSVNGIIGTWAGPAAPGTAYSLMHESIGDVGEGAINTGQGSWGYPIGGMGAVSAAIAASARSLGATIRTETWVDQILVSGGKATGVVLADGTQLTSDLVIAATHPKITFLDQVDRRELPADFVADIERWKTRSGTVKINLAIDRLPVFTFRSAPDSDHAVGGCRVRADDRRDRVGVSRGTHGQGFDRAVRRHAIRLDARSHARARGASRRFDVHPVGPAHVGRRTAYCRTRRVRRPDHRSVRQRCSRLRRLDLAPSGAGSTRDGEGLPPRRGKHLPRGTHP